MPTEMFNRAIRAWARRGDDGDDFDPSIFNDPLALETEWIPAARGGASFGMHRLIQPSANRVEFDSTVGAKVFCLLFFFTGSGLLLFQLNRIAQSGFLGRDTLVPALVGAAFAVVGAGMYRIGTMPRVFDRSLALFWRGRSEPTLMNVGPPIASSAPLSSIHALQLLSEFVSGSKNSYYSYELNLVLNDGRRINVVDHGNLKRLRSDAKTLSQFLDKPVWDATR